MSLSTVRMRWFSYCSVLLLGLSACADQVTIAKDECPEELITENGVCALEDPTEYNEFVETNGAPPSAEELLFVDDDIIQEQETVFLTQDGSGSFYVYINESKRVGIRAVNMVGTPVPGVRVSFQIAEGVESSNSRGSTLSAQIAETDQYGVAAIEVHAGSVPTSFKILINSDVSDEIPYTISVIQPNIVDTDVIDTVPPAQRCALVDISGNYALNNSYELGRFLGEGPFNVLRTIHQAMTDPGGLIGDWIRDRIGGWIGDAVRGIVRDVVNSLIRNANFPDWVDGAINVIADVTGFLTDLKIQGNLRFGKVQGPDCDIPGVHTWEVLLFELHDSDCAAFGGANCGEYPINLTEVGVSVSESEFMGRVVSPSALISEVEIGEHTLQLNIGVVVIALLENVILPRRSGVRSFGDLIARLVPCDRFGDLAASLVGNIPIIGGGVRSFATDACRDGVRALSNDLTRRLIEQMSVDTFRVKGRADFINRDGMPGAEVIENGVWEGDPNSNSFLQGTFTGERR